MQLSLLARPTIQTIERYYLPYYAQLQKLADRASGYFVPAVVAADVAVPDSTISCVISQPAPANAGRAFVFQLSVCSDVRIGAPRLSFI